MINDILSSLLRVLVGSSLGILFGVLLATFRFSLPLSWQKNPLVVFLFEFMRFPPPIAWLPFVILLFGLSPLASIFVVFLATFPPVQSNIYDGLGQIPQTIRRMACSLELNAWQKTRLIYLPMITPQIFTGIRLGLGLAWMAIIAAEMLSGQSGLGYSIQLHRQYMQEEKMLIDIAAIGAIGFLIHFFLKKLEWHYAPWAKK